MALSVIIMRIKNVPKNVANFGIFTKKLDYKVCFKILGVEETSDQEQIRAAYLSLVKRYHPDSGTNEANEKKFQEVDSAFRSIMKKQSKERWDVEEGVIVEDSDIKHTAPQHRQFLSYDGIGYGNPFQRQKQYAKVRAMQAAENVYDHRVAKATADEDSLLDVNRIHESWKKVPLKHKIKTKLGFDRLVEDLIQESISKGEFTNLKNKGKPLPSYQNRNPYVDFVTHKINEVLIENGFTPEWISLQKEVREMANQLRNDLLMERKHFGPYPLSIEDNIAWSEKVYKYKIMTNEINKKIAKFNLVVPVLNKQMLNVCLENEAQKALINGKSCKEILNFNNERSKNSTQNSNSFLAINLFGIIDYFLRGK